MKKSNTNNPEEDFTIKKEELEKYIGELSPEMQEKARECKDTQELNALLAENDVELSEDALEAVAGGCSLSSSKYDRGQPVTEYKKATCPLCGHQLYYWDMCHDERGETYITRMYCSNNACSSCNNGLWYVKAYNSGIIYNDAVIQKY